MKIPAFPASRATLNQASFARAIAVVTASLLALWTSVSAVTVAWSPSPEDDIHSYVLSYGLVSGTYTQSLEVGNNTTANVTGLCEGNTYYFVVTARNVAGLESAPSEEIIYQVPVNSPQTYAQWAGAAGLASEQAAALATPQGDGIPNLLKYAFRMDARKCDTRVLVPSQGTLGLPAIQLDTTGLQPVLRFEYVRRKTSALVYRPRKSRDLVNWEPVGAAESVVNLDTVFERVQIAEPCDPANPAHFGRIEVEATDL